MDLNRAQLIGNVTRDPELRTTPTGQTVCSFGVATNSQWTDAQGQKQQRAEFHNMVAWGKLAEICGQYLVKGKKVFVEGRLQTREWEAQDGAKRNRTEIVLDNMIMLDRGGQPGGTAVSTKQGASSGPTYEPTPSAPTIDKAIGEQEIRVEDIPF
ncbi:single-stranded DNA-binding protein [Candidatus Uhrbacteria bacterium]|nr:single-stranded DNA-binding protein [Candidatus Uhrbacteria bacterium]